MVNGNGQRCQSSANGQHIFTEESCYGTRNHCDIGGMILEHRIRRCACGANECFGWEAAKVIAREDWFGVELPNW